MSKYPVKYHSVSHGKDVDIETMHSAHLANAYKKRLASGLLDEVLAALTDELRARGAIFEGAEVKWPDHEPTHAEIASQMEAGQEANEQRRNDEEQRKAEHDQKLWRL